MITYKHYVGPSYGGLGVGDDQSSLEEQPLVRTQCVPYYPIREREKGVRGEVISEEEMIRLLVFADLKASVRPDGRTKSRFKGAKDGITIRS